MNCVVNQISRSVAPTLAALALTLSSTVALSGNLPASAGGIKRASITAQPTTPKVAGRGGYQGAFTYTVPTGLGELFFHYPCPTGFVARNGGFLPNSTARNGMSLVGNGPRFDISSYQEWFWLFRWPGAAAGSTITFDVYCTKLPI